MLVRGRRGLQGPLRRGNRAVTRSLEVSSHQLHATQTSNTCLHTISSKPGYQYTQNVYSQVTRMPVVVGTLGPLGREGGGPGRPKPKNHECTRLTLRPETSVIPACSSSPTDLEKWRRLRRVCRVWGFGTPWKARKKGLRGLEVRNHPCMRFSHSPGFFV